MSMEFKLRFDMKGSDFDEFPEMEVERILRSVAMQIGMEESMEAFRHNRNIWDNNGNVIGTFSCKEVE